MSGHSKWASIKRKKGAEDAKRGRLFTRLIKEISVAARDGGGNPDGNPRLRTAIQIAKDQNMPQNNIERAIKKGTGELPGVSYEEASFEGYGPAGVAIIIEGLTDNRQRIVAEVRHLFGKYNGNLAENGAVSWMFDKRGVIIVNPENYGEEEVMDIAIDAGAMDMTTDEDSHEIICEPHDFETVKQALLDAGIGIENAEITMLPQTTVKVEGRDAQTLLKLMDALEDNEDIQKVYSNFDISIEEMEKVS